MTPEQLQKLRRFSLAIGVILFSYVVADLTPVIEQEATIVEKEAATITLFSTKFKIGRPDLIPIGLVLASFWGLVRYWYYGPMTELAPWRHRRKIFAKTGKPSDNGWYALGFTRDAESDDFVILLQRLFPRFINRGLLFEVSETTRSIHRNPASRSSEKKKTGTRVTFNISQRQLAAAWFQDLDFYSPVYVNLFALGFWFNLVGRLTEFVVGIFVLGVIGLVIYILSERTSQPSLKNPHPTPKPK